MNLEPAPLSGAGVSSREARPVTITHSAGRGELDKSTGFRGEWVLASPVAFLPCVCVVVMGELDD